MPERFTDIDGNSIVLDTEQSHEIAELPEPYGGGEEYITFEEDAIEEWPEGPFVDPFEVDQFDDIDGMGHSLGWAFTEREDA